MSSHREAPGISKDPVADSTDVYAFVSPDKPDMVTLIANYVPLQGPACGPNFYEFGDDVLYSLNIDNNGDGHADVTYQFRFSTKVADEETFLYNTGPIERLNSPNWNRRQFYTVTREDHGHWRELGRNLACPPCNIGPLSTPGLPRAGRRRGARPRRGTARVRRAARRGLLRRPGLDLRPRRLAPVRQRPRALRAPPLPDKRSWRERDEEPQRPLHRAAGADHGPDL